MKAQTYGYVRISTKEQNEARQLAALAEHDIPPKNLFIDRQSGKDFDRPAYKKLIKRLTQNDLLIVQSIDRLGRDLTGTFIADLVLQILSYVAQTEREFIRKRQAEGIAAAKARGVHFGVARKPLPEGFEETKGAWQRGEISLREAAAKLQISHMTFYRRCTEGSGTEKSQKSYN